MSPDGPANVAVLVHGGTLTSTMWDPVRSRLASPSLAVDLPGRRYRPADLGEVTIGDWITSVVTDIEEAGLIEVVLVGHSSGGYVLPGVAAALAARSVLVLQGLVFVSATVPAHGERPLDYLRDDIRTLASDHRELTLESARGRTIGGLRPGEPAIETDLEIVENGPRMGLEAPRVLFEPVSWAGFPTEVPRVYVRALRDKVIPPELADRMISAMGGAEVIDLDAGHRSYDTHPAELAAVIDECSHHRR
ncbi:MAG TPA: alpha/beta hydrolase [Acidimicrobiales bacterium]|nr:alpha/beta hydrolase [Acidimicrobiales bacterium]